MTSSQNLKIERTPRDHESLFLDHYDWLLERARHLASGTAEDPQDLIQELYLSFTHLNASQQFADETHVRAYLRKALKNLFALRRMRHGTDAATRLALVNFDSVEFGLTAVDRSQLLHVRSDLAKISEYILARRYSSKGATVFLMWFFFGYLPSEIMLLLKLNRKTFEKMLLTTRLEAKAYVERPHVLRFLLQQEKRALEFPKYLPDGNRFKRLHPDVRRERCAIGRKPRSHPAYLHRHPWSHSCRGCKRRKGISRGGGVMQTILRIVARAGGYQPTLYLKIENSPYMALVIRSHTGAGTTWSRVHLSCALRRTER